MDAFFERPEIKAHNHALRPIAVIDHSYRTEYFEGDDIALELSLHNDTRHEVAMECLTEIIADGAVIWSESMPLATYGPAENKAFTCRFRAPKEKETRIFTFRATLRRDGTLLDQWEKVLTVHPLDAGVHVKGGHGIFDPRGTIADALSHRGVRGISCIRSTEELIEVLPTLDSVWIPFQDGGLRVAEWHQVKDAVEAFAQAGGVVVLDRPVDDILSTLPVTLRNGKGFAAGDRLEITYAFNIAPCHPVLDAAGVGKEVALWGEDLYVARRTFDIPQEGNAVPLLAAGTDRNGLTTSPLIELPSAQGSIFVNSLDILPKLSETSAALRFMAALLTYQPRHPSTRVGICVGTDTMRVLKEVGLRTEDQRITSSRAPYDALTHDLALLDGDRLSADDVPAVEGALKAGKTVYLHALDEEQTRLVLKRLNLPGAVAPGTTEGSGEYDTFRHNHALADGMTNNYLYWIVNKASVAAWTKAPLHPHPATALIDVAAEEHDVTQLTRRGAVTIYHVKKGTLVVDNLRWHDPGFDEPERPRRYVMTLLTNLGIPLGEGAAKRMTEEFETEAERRERGHF